MTAEAGSDPVLNALWERALESWNEDPAHAAVLAHAMQAQALPELASRYRALTSDAVKGEVARRRLEAVALAATQLLLATRTPKPGKVPLSITLSAVAVSAILLGWLALALWHH